ncbi:RNA polymerase sigma factor [Anoxynatronum sibiricum]|uniref:RNA polymerase sigma factor n=1 Tax=Anoxynatronum sibiricum TaxID=210623 RepID=A0ABU9W023_9CLOT
MIIQKCQANDPEGFRALMHSYGPLVYRTCFYYTQSREDTLDLMQETWLKVFRGIHTFDAQRPLAPWLRRIAANTCVTHLRQKPAPSLSLQWVTDETESTLEDLLPDPQQVEDQVLLKETRQLLRHTLLQLPEKMRTAIQLRHGEGFSYEAIAQEMQEPLGTVKTYLHRGRQALRAALQQQENDKGPQYNTKEGAG